MADRYDDLPPQVRREIEDMYPAPQAPQQKFPGRGTDGVPDTNDPRNWLTPLEMQQLGINPNDTSGAWKAHPGLRDLPVRQFPIPQDPRDRLETPQSSLRQFRNAMAAGLYS